MRSSALAAVCVLIVGAAACGGAGGPATPRPRIAVIQDGSFPDARSVVSPAVLGLEIALEDVADVLVVDVDGTGGEDAARAVAADPSVLGAVIAPFTAMSQPAIDTLAGSGIPILSLSSSAPAPPAGAPWRQIVPGAAQEARALGMGATALAPDGPVCLAGEGSAWSVGLRDLLEQDVPSAVPLRGPAMQAAEAAGRRGCAAVVWTGSAPGGAELRAAMGAGVSLLLASSARTDGYLETLGPLEEVQVGACPCADLTTASEAGPQGFVHTYQAATGLDPGPFAAEGYDMGGLLARLLPTAESRVQLAERLTQTPSFAGVAGTYRWGPEGDLLDPPVRMYQATGVRWLVEEPSAPS